MGGLEIITLYRGHKDENYLKSHYDSAVCFTEKVWLAKIYGEGKNDSSNLSVANGYITTVEFNGTMGIDNSLDGIPFCNAYPEGRVGYDAFRCRDDVIVVFNFDKLHNPRCQLASEVEVSVPLLAPRFE